MQAYVFKPIPSVKEEIEEQIAIVASEIEKCKREIRVGEEARARYVELQAQLNKLAGAYISDMQEIQILGR